MQRFSRMMFVVSVLAACIVLLGQVSAWAQRGPTFSIDFQGPTGGGIGPLNGTKDSFASIPIDEGAILTTGIPWPPPVPNPTSPGPLPAPGVLIGSVPGSGAPYGDLNLVPGIKDAVEVDALSFGRDGGRKKLFFSVDEFAVGDAAFAAGAPSTPPTCLARADLATVRLPPTCSSLTAPQSARSWPRPVWTAKRCWTATAWRHSARLAWGWWNRMRSPGATPLMLETIWTRSI